MRLPAALASAILLALIPATALAAPDGSTGVVDRPSGFGALPFDGISFSALGPRTISANGCFVVFESENDALFAGDDNAASTIFRKDRCSPGHPLQEVNTSASGAQPEPGSFAESPSISADGRFVAFASDDHNLSPAANGTEQAWVKDMQTGAVTLASRADGAAGQLATAVFEPVISGDGSHVAFAADDALAGANTDGIAGQTNVYVRDLAGGHTFLASVKGDGTAGGGVAAFDVSFDGSAVALVSSTQLAAGDTDTGEDAYIARNVTTSPTDTLVSTTTGADSADAVALSTDGKHVAWLNDKHPWVTTCDPACAPATNLDAGVDTTVTDNQQLIAVAFGYAVSGAAAGPPTHVFWSTTAALTPGDTNGAPDVYAHSLSDLTQNGLTRVTSGTDPAGVADPLASDDGSLLTFVSRSPALPGSNGAVDQVFLQAADGTTNLAQPEGAPLHVPEVGDASLNDLHAVGPHGQFTAFSSASPALSVPIAGGRFRAQVFLRDELSGATTPVSVDAGGAFGNSSSDAASVDATGDRVAFQSLSTNLATGVAPNFEHVYVRDLHSGVTTLLDRTTAGAVSSHGAAAPEISADGSTVVFISSSPDLPGATPDTSHVYAADVATGALTLVDATAGGTPGDRVAIRADVSADGSRVGFVSLAGNLGGSSADHASVYLKDLRTGAITWVSRPQDDNPLHTEAADVSLSADGQRVAFTEADPQFGFGSNGVPHVFVRDLGSGTTELASIGTPGGLGTTQRRPSLDADGGRLAFGEAAFAGHPATTYVRDLASGVLTPLESGSSDSSIANLDASGTCAAFRSSSPALSDPGYASPDFAHVYVRAIGGDCPHVAATVPGTGGAGGGPQPDTTAPVISRAHVTNARFRLAARRTAVAARRARRGTTFVFSLSEPARTTIAIALRTHRRFVNKLTLTRRRAVRGVNRVAFSGRTRASSLRPGRYRATLRATDAAGNRSKPRNVTFTVVRR